jgi:hypothetical protein
MVRSRAQVCCSFPLQRGGSTAPDGADDVSDSDDEEDAEAVAAAKVVLSAAASGPLSMPSHLPMR